jgi:Ala-tRNA(Pro) deacylase
MPKWIATTLEQQHVPFHPRHHRPRFTAQEIAAEEHFTGHRLAKVVVLKADDQFVEVVVPATTRVNMRAVQRELGCRECRLATEPEMAARFDDCEVGAIPPLRHWPDVPILVDRRMGRSGGPIVFQAGTHEDAIEMNFADWHRITQPREGDFVGAVN